MMREIDIRHINKVYGEVQALQDISLHIGEGELFGLIGPDGAGKTSLWQDFASIFGLTIANFIMVIPYILAFFAVFKISGGDITHEGVGGFFRAMFIIAGFFGGAAAWWTMLAFVINLFRRRFRPRHMLTINHVAGLIIGILGIYTILSTFFDIFPNVG